MPDAARSAKTALLVAAFAAGLLVVAWLRLQAGSAGTTGALARYATPLYVGISIAAAIAFIRAGIPLRRLGFGAPHKPLLFIVLALVGVGILQLTGFLLEPLWERAFGTGRDLSRFSGVSGSLSDLVAVLALSWTVAAFGEELAFRILLMRGVAYALGDSRAAFAAAMLIQAVVFGLVHAYQGPAGVAGTVISGLVYGALTLAARGSIWPAALAHGLGNSIGLLELYAGGV